MSRAAWCYKPRGSIGVKPLAKPPSEVDFNLWLGPAADQAVPRQPGPLQLALVLGLRQRRHRQPGRASDGHCPLDDPGATCRESVLSLGGRFGYTDQGETPNTQITVFDYGDAQLIFEVRGLKTGPYRREKIGNIVHLDTGVIAGGKFYPKGSDKPQPLPVERGSQTRARRRDTSATSSRPCGAGRPRTSTPTSSKAITRPPCATWPTSPTAWARRSPFNPQTKAFGDNKDAYETLARMEEHLAKDNGLKLDGKTYRLGRKLAWKARPNGLPATRRPTNC